MRSCPKCKTSAYNNRNFTLLINECGHSLCRNCVDNLFVRNSAPCPTCGRTLKRQTFWQQTFDDPHVEKEVYFRKKLKKIYNLQEDDFTTLLEYNNYLEQFEKIVANLTNDTDVTRTQDLVAAFQAEHKEAIAINRNRKTADETYIAQCLEEEKQFMRRVNEYKTEDARLVSVQTAATNHMKSQQRALIDELAQSDMPAELIVDKQRKTNIEQRQQRVEQQDDRPTDQASEAAKQRRQAKARVVVPYTFYMTDTNLSAASTEMYCAVPAPQLSQMHVYGQAVDMCESDVRGRLAGAFTADLVACHAIHFALQDISMNCLA